MNTINLFDKFLILTGLRKEIKSSCQKESSKKMMSFLHRDTVSINKKRDNDELEFSQPRMITRGVYQRIYNKTLSPSITRRETVIEIPTIQNLQNFSVNRPLEIEFERHKKKENSKKDLYIILSWCYTVFIMLLLWVQPIYTISHIINTENSVSFYGPTLCFNLIYPIQYMISIKYFSTDHFEKFYKCTQPDLNEKLPDINLVFKLFILMLIGYGLLIFLILFSDTIQGDNDKEFPNFKTFDIITKIFLGSLFIVEWIYGRLTLSMNVILFCLTFSKHCLILKNFTNKISKYENEIDHEISINIISQDILKIRHDLDQSIDNFKDFFSIITILGAISIGILIEHNKDGTANVFPWSSLVFYFIFQLIFLIIIWKVENYRDDLTNYIKSANFVKKFLTRYTDREITKKFDETQMVMLNIMEENSTTIDWVVLHRVLSEEWSNFSVFGIPVSDGNLIKRGVALVALIVTINNHFK